MTLKHVRSRRLRVDVDPDTTPFVRDMLISWSPAGLARAHEVGDTPFAIAEAGPDTDAVTGKAEADVQTPEFGIQVDLTQVAGADRTKLGDTVYAVDHLHNYTMTDNGSPVGPLLNIFEGMCQIAFTR